MGLNIAPGNINTPMRESIFHISSSQSDRRLVDSSARPLQSIQTVARERVRHIVFACDW